MNEIEITKLISKRVMVSAINVVILIATIPIFMYSMGYLISEELLNGWLTIAIVLFAFALHYAILPILSKGQNIGYMIFGLRMISIEKNQNITLLMYLLHALYAIVTYIKSYGFLITQFNNLGQLQHDEKFRLTVTDIKSSMEEDVVPKVFEKNMILPFVLGNFIGVIVIPLVGLAAFVLIGNIVKFVFS